MGESHHLSEGISNGEPPLPGGSADLSAPGGVPARAPSDSAPLAGEHAHAGGASHRDADLETTLLRVVACCECLYPLRGLARDGLCPECGTPIAESLRQRSIRDPLDLTPVRFLRRMALGLQLAWCGACILAFLGIVCVQIMSRSPSFKVPNNQSLRLAVAAGAAWTLVQIGLFMLSAKEPGHIRGRSYAREALRISAGMLSVGSIPIAVGVALDWWLNPGGPRLLYCASLVGVVLGWGAIVLQSFALPTFIAELATRASNPELASMAHRRKYIAAAFSLTMLGPFTIMVLIISLSERLRKSIKGVIATERTRSSEGHINSASTISNVSSPPGSRT